MSDAANARHHGNEAAHLVVTPPVVVAPLADDDMRWNPNDNASFSFNPYKFRALLIITK